MKAYLYMDCFQTNKTLSY